MALIPVFRPLLNGNEKKYLLECIKTGWISSEGNFVKKFEEEFAARVGRKYGIAVCNGSAAMDIAVKALDIKPDDEVIIPTFTIISSAASVVRTGATPVVVDSDPVTWNMDINQIKTKLTAKTKAIIAVHTYGLPVDMDQLMTVAKKYNLKVIEDAAEMHGQTYKGRPCGSFGEISIFSFYFNKIVSTGEGGMVLTDNQEIAERCRLLRNLSFSPERRFFHEELGWNYRITNLQAAVGLAQLERLDEFVRGRRKLGKYYTQLFSKIPQIQLPLEKTGYAENIYWVYGMVLGDKLSFDAAEAIRRLAKNYRVEARPFFWPMHEQPVFLKMGLFKNESCPISERLARRGLYIPTGMGLTNKEIQMVVNGIRDLVSAA
jgi:perosamine synthetase